MLEFFMCRAGLLKQIVFPKNVPPVVSLAEAQKYHAYARKCLRLAETADKADIQKRLIELSRVWMEAALTEEKHTEKAVSAAR